MVVCLHTKGTGGLPTCILMETVVYLHANRNGVCLHTKRNGGLTIRTLTGMVAYLHTKGNGGLSIIYVH